MRLLRIIFVLSCCTFALAADDLQPERAALLTRLVEQSGSAELEFSISTAAPSGRGELLFPIEIKVPVDQLRFVPDDDEQVAIFSVYWIAGKAHGRTINVVRESDRVFAPL